MRLRSFLLLFLLLLFACHAAPPAAAPTPRPANANAAPANAARPPPAVALPAPAPKRPEVLLYINAIAARDERFMWLLGDQTWQPARYFTRLKLDTEVDWIAYAYDSEAGALFVIRHQLPHETLRRVLQIEAEPLASAESAWAPRAARDGLVIWELDDRTLAFGRREAMRAMREGGHLATLLADAPRSTLPLTLVAHHDDERRLPLREARVRLTPDGSRDIDFLVELEATTPADATRVRAHLLDMLQERDLDHAGTTLQQFFDKLDVRVDGATTRVHAVASRLEVVSAVDRFRRKFQ